MDTAFSMVILAGGQSRRMGYDKADLLCGRQTFLECQIQKARQLGIGDILVSGYHGMATPTARIIPDRFPGRGPLGGLETCLRAAAHEKCLVLSVDIPLAPVAELERLMEQSLAASAPVTILESRGREQPLIGVYDRSLSDAMLREITVHKGSVFALIRRVGYEVYESPAHPRLFSNINTPEEYQAALCGTEENNPAVFR